HETPFFESRTKVVRRITKNDRGLKHDIPKVIIRIHLRCRRSASGIWLAEMLSIFLLVIFLV
ncbi:TPA: hypothetical protein ACSRYJ_005305, partial [Enterobacter hormaechei subsp. steigerwaltii]